MHRRQWRRVVIGSLLILAAGFALVVTVVAIPTPTAPPIQYGVSFSPAQAEGLGLPWQETYQAILHDLGVKRLRIAVYWNQVEPERNVYDFSQLDYQLDEAAAAGAQVIVAIGRKVPRWPECHDPDWIAGISDEQAQAELTELFEVIVTRYRTHPALRMWQLENEPFLDFGVCTTIDHELLAQEEALIRRLDPGHPIMVTDSGELNWWLAVSAYGDVVGTTLYRTVHSSRTNQPFHYDYLYPAWLYRAKARLVWLLRGKPVLVSELQGEPWGAAPFVYLSDSERAASFSPERFKEIARFVSRTQLPEAYWWGVEYWYWEQQRGYDAFWEYARELFNDSSQTP